MQKTVTEDGIIVGVWDKNESIELKDYNVVGELRPMEFHIKVDGDIHNAPSLAIIMQDDAGRSVVGQISFRMFAPVMKVMGQVAMEHAIKKAKELDPRLGEIAEGVREALFEHSAPQKPAKGEHLN